MSGYVIRNEHGEFLGPPMPPKGSCWTRDLRKARRFPRREIAERELCPENETIVPVEMLLSSKE